MLLLRRYLITAFVIMILCSPSAGVSIGLPTLPKPPPIPKVPSLPIPDVTDLMNGEAITTSLSDAVTGIPYLNDYAPGLGRDLTSIPHNSSGEFDLISGSYWYNGRSYCLHAGKHGPMSGSSYLFAPLKGPRAHIIEDILRNSASHLEIPQQTVQQLIWAILARAKISDTSPDLQAAAVKLLSPEELLELNTNAVAFIPADKFNALLDKIPDPMRPVLDAENSLRGMLTSNATYQDMERVAVLPGVPEPSTQAQAQATVRWSYDPHGFFLWFIPRGYWWTTTYLDVPGAVTERRDQLGRIMALQDNKGNNLAVSYASADSNVDGDPQTKFYRISSLRFIWQDGSVHQPKRHQETWQANELVMVGVPNGRGQVPAAGSSSNAQAQYDNANGLRGQFSGLLRQIHGQDSALSELMTLAEFRSALESIAADKASHTQAAQLAASFPVNAWESALARSTGGRVAADVRAGVDQAFNPSNNTGVPQNSNAQRLAQSPNPYPGSTGGSPLGGSGGGSPTGQGKPPGKGKPQGNGNPPGPPSSDPWQQLINQGFQNAGYPYGSMDTSYWQLGKFVDLNWTYTTPNGQIDGQTVPFTNPKGFTVGWWTSISATVNGNPSGYVSGFGDSPATAISDALNKLTSCCGKP
jgi:hypothetical protein